MVSQTSSKILKIHWTIALKDAVKMAIIRERENSWIRSMHNLIGLKMSGNEAKICEIILYFINKKAMAKQLSSGYILWTCAPVKMYS